MRVTMDALTSLPWSGLQVSTFVSGWALVAAIVWMLVTGRGGIALRSEVEAALRAAETFKQAWETSEKSKEVLAAQVGELNQQVSGHTVYLQTADKILAALDAAREREEMRDQLAREARGGNA